MMNKRRARRWEWISAGVAALAGTVWLGLETEIPQNYIEAPSLHARAKAAGAPLIYEDYNPPRTGQSAAIDYARMAPDIRQIIDSSGMHLAKEIEIEKQRDVPDEAKLETLMREHANLFSKQTRALESLSTLPVYDFQTEGSRLWEGDPKAYSLATPILNLAVLDARQKNRSSASRRIRIVTRLGNQLQQGPSIVDFLAAGTCRIRAIHAVRRCIAADPEGARQYMEALGEPPDLEARAMVVLRRNVYEYIYLSSNYHGIFGDAKLIDPNGELPGDWVSRAAYAYGLRFYIPILEQITPEGDVKDEQALRVALDEFDRRAESDPGLFNYLVRAPLSTLKPRLAKFYTMCRSSLALEQCLRAIAHYVEHKEWPSPMPDDPFSEAPVQARIDGDRIMVYSVGRNENDDGGTKNLDIRIQYQPGNWW
jgi:hypothetical protein